MLRAMSGYLIAVFVTYLVGVVFISQVNLNSIIELGMTVGFGDRANAVIHDVTHMYNLYLPLVAIALLIAFLVAAVIIKFFPDLRFLGYVLAGFVGLLAIHVIIKMAVGITGIAATRSLVGLILQGVAGGVGGWLFHLFTRRETNDDAKQR